MLPILKQLFYVEIIRKLEGSVWEGSKLEE